MADNKLADGDDSVVWVDCLCGMRLKVGSKTHFKKKCTKLKNNPTAKLKLKCPFCDIVIQASSMFDHLYVNCKKSVYLGKKDVKQGLPPLILKIEPIEAVEDEDPGNNDTIELTEDELRAQYDSLVASFIQRILNVPENEQALDYYRAVANILSISAPRQTEEKELKKQITAYLEFYFNGDFLFKDYRETGYTCVMIAKCDYCDEGYAEVAKSCHHLSCGKCLDFNPICKKNGLDASCTMLIRKPLEPSEYPPQQDLAQQTPTTLLPSTPNHASDVGLTPSFTSSPSSLKNNNTILKGFGVVVTGMSAKEKAAELNRLCGMYKERRLRVIELAKKILDAGPCSKCFGCAEFFSCTCRHLLCDSCTNEKNAAGEFICPLDRRVLKVWNLE